MHNKLHIFLHEIQIETVAESCFQHGKDRYRSLAAECKISMHRVICLNTVMILSFTELELYSQFCKENVSVPVCSPFLMECLKEYYLTYDDTRLRWNGAHLLTRVSKKLELKVQPSFIFFPISRQNITRYSRVFPLYIVKS